MKKNRRLYGIAAAALAVVAVVAGVILTLTSHGTTPNRPVANTSTSVPVNPKTNQPETVGSPSLATVPSSATSAPKATTAQVTATPTHRNTPQATPSTASSTRHTPTPSITPNPDPYLPYHGKYYSESQRATMVFGNKHVSCNGHPLKTYQAKLSYKGGGTVCMDFVVAKIGLKGHITYPVVSGGGQNVRLTHEGSGLSLSANADGIPDLHKVNS